MLLDPDAVVRRAAVITAAVIMAGTVGAVTWYNVSLKKFFDQSVEQTAQLQNQTGQLTQETGTIKQNLEITQADTTRAIRFNRDQLQEQITQQQRTIAQLQQELDRLKTEQQRTAATLVATQEQVKQLAQDHERNKSEVRNQITGINDLNRITQRDLQDLRVQLQREQEWRNRTFWSR